MGSWGVGPWEGDAPYDALGDWARTVRGGARTPDRELAAQRLLGLLEQADVPCLTDWERDEDAPLPELGAIDPAAWGAIMEIAFLAAMGALSSAIARRDEQIVLAIGALAAQARASIPTWPACWPALLAAWDGAEPEFAQDDGRWRDGPSARKATRQGVRAALGAGTAPPSSIGLMAHLFAHASDD